MPWKETSVLTQRADLAQEMIRRNRPVREIAAKFEVSRTTAYKWLRRFEQHGRDGIKQRSRRPQRSPNKTPDAIEDEVCELRDQHDTWGPDKLHHELAKRALAGLPSRRTVARVLKRRGCIEPKQPAETELTRFEREAPNELWQIDFKKTCHLSFKPPIKAVPMAILDDHSRFNITLLANPNRQFATIWPVLWEAFGEYGMPDCIFTDNDTVFRGHSGGITAWTARLWRLGVKHISGRAYHPQTQGKVERFHGTVQTDVLERHVCHSLQELQAAFDEFREVYNHQRPHAALNLDVPADHYAPSRRKRPDEIPPVEYPERATLRKVMHNGAISVRNCRIHIGEGIAGERVRLHDCGDQLDVEYAGQMIREVRWDDLRLERWI